MGMLKPSSNDPGPAVPTPPNQPPSTAVNCAAECGTCKLSTGTTTTTVYEGAVTV